MPSLIDSNIHFLRQGLELLSRIDNHLYSQPVESFYGSSLGGHMRHCLDHYDSLVNGVDELRIDYDARGRDRSIEASIETATARINQLINLLDELATSQKLDATVQVKMDCGVAAQLDWQISSIGRELQFLVSHTVHHFAMMKGMCNALGIDTPAEFGIAPSTLKALEPVY